jgi:hypothetical protein
MKNIGEEEYFVEALRGYKLAFKDSTLIIGEEKIFVQKGVP